MVIKTVGLRTAGLADARACARVQPMRYEFKECPEAVEKSCFHRHLYAGHRCSKAVQIDEKRLTNFKLNENNYDRPARRDETIEL
jgi:hypothetical protein